MTDPALRNLSRRTTESELSPVAQQPTIPQQEAHADVAPRTAPHTRTPELAEMGVGRSRRSATGRHRLPSPPRGPLTTLANAWAVMCAWLSDALKPATQEPPTTNKGIPLHRHARSGDLAAAMDRARDNTDREWTGIGR